MNLRIILALLMASCYGSVGTAWADYEPSGPRSYYNADIDSTRRATGGPLRNYLDSDTWRKVNPAFRLEAGQLVSDSGRHTVTANLSTNRIDFDWSGHILGIEVSNLYAFRRSTLQRFQLATPDFTDRSFEGAIITIHDIYPNVDLEIENTPDDLKHRFIFHQAARGAFDTWWQNNGSLDDIYIINTFRLYVGQLNCNWRDEIGDFDLSVPRDITGRVRLLYNNAVEFFMPDSPVELWAAPGNDTTLYKRILLIGGHPYLAEGFKWAAVRGWADGNLVHNSTFGSSTTSGSATMPGDDVFYGLFQMGATTGTGDSIYVMMHNNWNTNDTAIFAIYDDADTTATDLVATAVGTAIISSSSPTAYPLALSGETLTGNAGYWLGAHNSASSNANISRSSSQPSNWQCATNDPLPLNDPATCIEWTDAGAHAWVVYTEAGAPAAASPRRRKLLTGAVR